MNREFREGLFLKSAYTWSNAINPTHEDGNAHLDRNWDPMVHWNRAPAGYDRTHMFSMGFVSELACGPGTLQLADQVASAKVQAIGEIGPNKAWVDPLAFRQPTGVRFGNTGRNTMRQLRFGLRLSF